ncbi:transporter substrate-binding domain-containing protein [Marivirga sp. S37H4]|uniref:histidine kinase n=1 Tax=Marivirga aurantiaca TaxID=2802615 RepID=A0A934X1Y1_9BACT|nr:ATP-binding protein [Marivirga aurantiaca]MBK6266987.1 transporter substrate-binding domain-containing protein [Marivirga aurantiaca]
MVQICFLLIGVFSALAGFASNEPIHWQEANKSKSAQLDLHWFVSKPFIYQDEFGNMKGLEVEMLNHFQLFVKEKYGIDLKLNWIESEDFVSIQDKIAGSPFPNSIGVSAFSITEERRKRMKFSTSYLSDVTVLVTAKGTPIVKTLDEINKLMDGKTAVTIKGTTYEKFLWEIEKQLNLHFNMLYIDSDKNILEEISKTEEGFGFIDLPIYLMLIKNGGELTRQNFFTMRGNGYSFVLPPNSSWDIPLNEYLSEPESKVKIAKIVSKYISPELFVFIENIYGEDNLGASILTKEKEIQLNHIKNAELQLEKEKYFRSLLIIFIIVITVAAIVIFILLYNKQKFIRKLSKQKLQIELQQKNIRIKNEKLLNRNIQLTSLNEERNNLVKILAHDLRTPINHITGLVEVFQIKQTNLPKEDIGLITKIKESANRLNQMIHKILDLDALEGNRMKVIFEEIDVNQLMVELKNSFRQSTENKNIHLDLKLKESILFKSDHLFLTQILENLVSNAIKFSDSGSEISLSVEQIDNKVVFKVQDEGPGLTQNDKQLIFSKYQKLSAKPTQGESSMGLGLSIVKKYVELLGGSVWVESEIGKGSQFFVSLPYKKSEA